MKKMLSFLVLFGGAVLAAQAADPVPPMVPPKANGAVTKQVKFPDFPGPKPPPPVVVVPKVEEVKVDPLAPVKLNKGQYYVIASPKPLLVLSSGSGEVTVQERNPPFMLPATDAIGWTPDAKDPEFVTWGADQYTKLYVVKGSKSGPVDLLVFPALCETDKDGKQIALTAKDVVKKAIQVDDGTGPIPPPKPVDPKVDPKPVDPKVDPIPNPAKGFRVVFIYEKQAKLTDEQLHIANSTKIKAYLNEKCVKDAKGKAEWRSWDKSTIDSTGLGDETALWQQVWKDAQPKLGKLPQVVILVDQGGVTKEWPATEDEMLKLLKQYGGE